MSRLRRGVKIVGGLAVCGVCYATGLGAGMGPPLVPEPPRVEQVEVPVPVVSERIVKERIEVPVEVVTEKVVVKRDLPQVCVSMIASLSDASKLNAGVSAETSKVLPLLDGAVSDINARDFKALNDAIQEARALRDRAGTKQIAFADAEAKFISSLEICRKEIEAR